MILRAGLHQKVIHGAKTEERFPVRTHKGYTKACSYRVSIDYAVRIRVKDATKPDGFRVEEVCRVLVSEVERSTLGAMTDESAKAEGFASLEEFKEHWCERYAWRPQKEVWVVRFKLHTDETRILARDSTHGYATSPSQGLGRFVQRVDRLKHDEAEPEPQSVREEESRKMTEDAHARFNTEHIEEIVDVRARQLGNSIAKLIRQARKAGVDITPKVEALFRETNEEITESRKAA